MELRLVSSERTMSFTDVYGVFAKSPVGWFGILPRHAPAIFLLQNSPLRVKLPEGEKVFLVKNGVIYVRENRVTVTADEIQSA